VDPALAAAEGTAALRNQKNEKALSRAGRKNETAALKEILLAEPVYRRYAAWRISFLPARIFLFHGDSSPSACRHDRSL
jgi:hypothetical protein